MQYSVLGFNLITMITININLLSVFSKKHQPKAHLFIRCCPKLYEKNGAFSHLQRVLKSSWYENTIDAFTATILIVLIFEMIWRPDKFGWALYVQILYLSVYPMTRPVPAF